MEYRIILTRNGEYKKTLHRCKTRETAYINFIEFKELNESIIFPKKFINYGKIKPVEYKVLLVKDVEDGDKNRLVRDELGRLYEEKPLGGIWTIIDSAKWDEEESFWLYGHNPKSDRKGLKDILKKLMVGAYSKKNVKQIVVVHNKLVIHSEKQFDMVLCKCREDAKRLHDKLYEATMNNKITGLLFLGVATPATISRMYEVIHEHTGWPYTKIRRVSTRH